MIGKNPKMQFSALHQCFDRATNRRSNTGIIGL